MSDSLGPGRFAQSVQSKASRSGQSVVKVHRSAAGGEGGTNSRHRSLAKRTPIKINAHRPRLPPTPFPADWRTDCRIHGWVAVFGRLPTCCIVLADKGFHSDAARWQIWAMEAAPNISLKVICRWKPCFSPVFYRDQNAIVRMFERFNDFRRIATRYDRLARTDFAAVCLDRTVGWWL